MKERSSTFFAISMFFLPNKIRSGAINRVYELVDVKILIPDFIKSIWICWIAAAVIEKLFIPQEIC